MHVTECEAQLWDVSQQNAPWESLVTSCFFVPSTFDQRETDSLTQLVIYRSDERHFHTFRKGRKGLFGGLVLTLGHGVCCFTVPLSLLPDLDLVATKKAALKFEIEKPDVTESTSCFSTACLFGFWQWQTEEEVKMFMEK